MAMNSKIKDLLVRGLVGVVYVVLMVAGVFYPHAMVALMCLFSLLAIHEFCKLTAGPHDDFSEILMMLFAILQFALILLLMTGTSVGVRFTEPFVESMLMMSILLVAYMLVMASAEIFRKRPSPIEQIGKSVFGFIWIVIPLGMLAIMTYTYPVVVLAFLLLIWCNDTFAFIGGSLFGKHKMFERVSPKKTWEGAITGVVASLVLAVFLSKIPYFMESSCFLNTGPRILFALLTVLFGILGDLLESIFKRNAGVKDSGHIMPGHGGILDRLDSILFSATPVFIFVFCLDLSFSH